MPRETKLPGMAISGQGLANRAAVGRYVRIRRRNSGMSLPTIVFSHGQESGPWGSKIRSMSDMAKGLGCEIDSIDYQGIADPTQRVDKLITACEGMRGDIILVGSSMGGHVATAAATPRALNFFIASLPSMY